MDPAECFSDIARFGYRMLAEMNEFCARGAPKFRKFCNSSLKNLRGFRVISTLDAHSFGSEQMSDFIKSCNDVTRLAKRTLADCTHFFCERHAEEYSEVLHFFRGIFVQILHELL